ncbi:MAG TPA: cadherin domain-containing protein, partial [Chitinophagaceae bacterium]|nr:cadherin domain-containing protein [Chitinophagaceae bacterium]
FIDGGHGHCAIPLSQRPAIEAFVDKFLLDKTNVNTEITVHPFPDVDYERWYKWWGTGKPVLPAEPVGTRLWMEAECAVVGSNWQKLNDAAASNGQYIVVNGLNSTAGAPAGADASVVFQFTIDSAANYNVMARLNCPTANDDSYWVKVDGGAFASFNGLTTTGWQWVKLTAANLGVGQHTITIAYREDGAQMDKLLLTTSGTIPKDLGTVASNCTDGVPVITPNQVFSVSETFANDSTFGTVLATDPDGATDFQNWKIVGGSGAGAFTIDLATGKLIMKDNTLLDFESATRSYTLELTVTDGYHKSLPETITIQLTNANDNAPAVTPSMTFALDGGSCNTLAGNVTAADADDTNEPGFTTFQNWQITGGNGSGIFAIDPATGKITIAHPSSIDFSRTSYTLKVTVSDGDMTSTEQDVTITIAKKIKVCHKNKNVLSIGKMDVPDHLAHGDCIGSCGTAPAITNRTAATIAPDAAAETTIRVYPNPSTGIVNITLGANLHNTRKIEVVDISGKTVMQLNVGKAPILTIPAGKLRAGTYLVRITGDKTTIQKLVIQ